MATIRWIPSFLKGSFGVNFCLLILVIGQSPFQRESGYTLAFPARISLCGRVQKKRNLDNTVYHKSISYHGRPRATLLIRAIQKNDSNDDGSEQRSNEEGILSRFISPKIDDRGLPFADALTTQVVGPSLQVFWLALNHAPSPTWLKPLMTSAVVFLPSRGTLVAPTLIHGAGLASCWIAGALAAKAYEREAFDISVNGGSYFDVLNRLFKAGAFAVGILILCTQVDLFLEFGGRYIQLGESEETDIRLLSAYAEIINDIVFEGLTISAMRIYLASRSKQ
jgi:hypothetical protein